MHIKYEVLGGRHLLDGDIFHHSYCTLSNYSVLFVGLWCEKCVLVFPQGTSGLNWQNLANKWRLMSKRI